MEPIQDIVTCQDGADSFAFTASAHGGAIRLRASGRRTLVADHHEHQLHIHLVLECPPRRRVLRGNKSGSVAEFLAMRPDRRTSAVARVVARARFPPGYAESVERFCTRAARAAQEKRCDDVTVMVDWTPARERARQPCGEVAIGDAGVRVLQFASESSKHLLGYFGL